MDKIIKVKLTDREVEFIKKLAKRDNMTEQKAMSQMFYNDLTSQMELYEDELNNE